MLKHLKSFLLFGIHLLYAAFALGQSAEVDSLKTLILKLSDKDTNKIINLNELGRQYWSISSYNDGINSSEHALFLANKLGYVKGRMMAYNVIATCYYAQAEYPKALQYYLIALNDAEKIKDRKRISKFYNNIGSVYQAQNSPQVALEYFFKALTIKKEFQEDKRGLSSCLTNIGNVYSELRKYDTAIQYHTQAYKIDSAANDKKSLAVGYTNIAQIYHAQGKYKESILYNQKSLKLRQEVDDKKGVAINYANMGEDFSKLENYPTALRFSMAALNVAKQINSLGDIADCYTLLAETFEKTKNFEKALYYRKKSQEAHDSIFNLGNSRLMSGEQAKYEVQKKEFELKVKAEAEKIKTEAEKKRQQTIIYAISAILALLVGFSFIVYNRYKLISRQKGIIETQKQVVEHKNAEITHSINYALRIQQAILPRYEELTQHLKEFFVLYKPKDIVSGDFYYLENIKNTTYLAAIDCTGHGVPGAFMSMIGHEALNTIIMMKHITSPGLILDELNKEVRSTLKQEENDNSTRDGMDVALCALKQNPDGTTLCTFAGAMRPLWLFRNNGELSVLKGDKQPIGGYYNQEDVAFSNKETILYPGDTFYIFSDGYADQFGGPEGKKFTTSRFKTFLQAHISQTMTAQKSLLEEAISNWRGENDQVDDILVIGVRA